MIQRFLPLIMLFFVSGCTVLEFGQMGAVPDSDGRYIVGVPFFKQSGNDCGPAALASVLSYYGVAVSLPEITAAIYIPKLRGTLPFDMELYAKSRGLPVRSMKGDLTTIRSWIEQGAPVICLIDMGFWVYRRPHYVTVIGYDDSKGVLIMHNGAAPDRTASINSFEQAWQRAGNWMLVIGNGKGAEK